MSWTKLLGRYVTAEPTSREELDNLRSIVTRSLQDAGAEGLSADARFIMAYDAARTLSLIVVRSEGYKPFRICSATAPGLFRVILRT